MVVTNAIFESGRRPGRLDSTNETGGEQDGKGVVDRLNGNCADLAPDGLDHTVGRYVGLTRHRLQDGQPLSGHLDAMLAKKIGRLRGHRSRLGQNTGTSQILE